MNAPGYRWYTKEEVSSWPEGHKKCRGCGDILSLSSFHAQKQTLFNVNNYCKGCRGKESSAKWQRIKQNIEKNLLTSARARSKRGGYPCTITLKDIVVPEFCPVLGIPIYLDPVKPHYHSPSLDKKIPKLGYVPGNVVVMSHKANILKHNATAKEARMLADWMEKNCAILDEQVKV